MALEPNLLTGAFITYSETNPIATKFGQAQITFKLADHTTVTGQGRLITPHACYHMIKAKFDDTINDTNLIGKDYTGYFVGKEALLQIIAQQDCEGVMIIDCLNDLKEPSLVLAGIDKNKDLLKINTFLVDDDPKLFAPGAAPMDIPIIAERVGKKSTSSILDEIRAKGALNDKSNEEQAHVLTNAFFGIV